MATQQSDIFESLIAIVSGNQMMANILREQCVLYGFNNTHIFSDWDDLLPTLSEELPDIIVSDHPPQFHNEQTQESLQSQMVFYNMIPVVLYSQSFDDSSQKIIPEGLAIVASLHGRDEQQHLLEVIHEELDKRFFDVGKLTSIRLPKHLNIVVVTGNSELSGNIHQVLEKEGYYVAVIRNGKDALEYIEGILPHIVFLDYNLPQLNGFAVFQSIQIMYPEIAVIMMGGEDSDSPELAAELLKAGVHSYLKKPFDVNILPTLCKGISKAAQQTTGTEGERIEPEQSTQVIEELESLRKSEENLRTLVNASGDLVFQINPQGLLNFASPAVEKQLGYTWDDLEKEHINIAKFVHPEDFIRVMVSIRQVIRGAPIKGLECRLMHQDKMNFRWYSINCYPMYNSQKHFVGVGGIARDIGSIKKIELEIQKQNERLSASNEIARIVNQSLNLVDTLNNVIDKVLEIMRLQAGAIFLLDFEAAEFILKSCQINSEAVSDMGDLLNMGDIHDVLPEGTFEIITPLVVDDISQHSEFSNTFLAKMGFRTLVTIPVKSKEIPIGIMILLTREERTVNEDDLQLLMSIGNQVGMTIENINLYQQEMKAKKRLEELNKLKDDFVAIVSHDLRSPLTAILGASEILLSEEVMDPPLTEEQKALVRNVQIMGNQQLQLVNDLLDLAKIESGELELNPTMTDIRVVAQQCCETLHVLADNKNITMDFVAKSDIPKINIDVPKISQVINNLVGNAIKFTEPGGTVVLRIDTEDHKSLRVSVIDSGGGIEPEHLLGLFNKFQQVRNWGTRGERGTGLGLSICKNLIDLHHGEIWAESRIGIGSTFAFTLPILERIILIVDDSLTVIKAMRDMLLEHLEHVKVKYALNGQDALQLIEEIFPVVLILDYMMPNMDGLATFRELKHRYGTRVPPTIFLTASQDPEVKREIFELGANDYLQKPIDVNDLLPRISRFL